MSEARSLENRFERCPSGEAASCQAENQVRLVLFYDATCDVCRRCVAWLTARRSGGRIVCHPIQDRERLRTYGIRPEAARTMLHAVEIRAHRERILSGAPAMLGAISSLRGYGWVRWIAAVPPLRWLAERAYEHLERRRRDRDCC